MPISGEGLQYIINIVLDKTGAEQARATIEELSEVSQKAGITTAKGMQVVGHQMTRMTRMTKDGAVNLRNYVIQFRDTNGQLRTAKVTFRETAQGLQMVGKSAKISAEPIGKLEKQTQSLIGGYAKLALRAIAVIPVWMLLRNTYMLLIRTVTESIRTWLDLEKELGRVAGVTRGTQEDIDNMRERIIEYSRTASRGFKEAASALYALGSAGLTVTEQMAGFKHIMDLTIGTFGDTEQIAKLVAGSYNVFGDSLEGAYTASAKMKQIADILAYTYSTQQVELSEIATAMTYVASVGSLINISFEQLVGTIGVLNTGMLKGTKAGTSLLNAFAQIAQQSDRLADLGVVFDPSQPLDYFNIITQLHNKYGETALSLQSLREIMQTFGRRGGRAVAQLIAEYDRWTESLDNAHKNFNDFADEMAEKAENTLPMAIKKLGVEIKASLIDKFRDAGDVLKEYINNIIEVSKSKRLADTFGAVLPTEGLKYQPGGDITIGHYKLSQLGEQLVESGGDWLTKLVEINEESKKIEKTHKQIKTLDEMINSLAQQMNEGKRSETEVIQSIYDYLKNTYNLENLRGNTLGKFLQLIREELKLRKEIIDQEVKIRKEQEEKIRKIDNAFKYQMMELEGIRSSVIQYEKLNDLVEQFKKDSGTNLDIQRLLNADFSEWEERLLHAGGYEKELLAIRKESVETIKEMASETKKYSNELKSVINDVLSGVLTGDIATGNILKELSIGIKESLAGAISEGLSQAIIDSGIGDIFGGMGQQFRSFFEGPSGKMKNAFDYGGTRIETALKVGFDAGVAKLESALGKTIAADVSGAKSKEASQLAKLMGAGLQVGMGTLSGYGGGGRGSGWSAAMGGVGAGLMALGPNPVSKGVGMALTIGSMLFQNLKAKTEYSESQRTLRVTSRIDVTNKKLEIVNRNLIALRSDLTYILPQSAYFSTKRGLEEEFSLHSRRGLI